MDRKNQVKSTTSLKASFARLWPSIGVVLLVGVCILVVVFPNWQAARKRTYIVRDGKVFAARPEFGTSQLFISNCIGSNGIISLACNVDEGKFNATLSEEEVSWLRNKLNVPFKVFPCDREFGRRIPLLEYRIVVLQDGVPLVRILRLGFLMVLREDGTYEICRASRDVYEDIREDLKEGEIKTK